MKAMRQLKTWNVIVTEVEDPVAYDKVLSSEYRPSPRVTQDIIRSPIHSDPARRTNPWELVLWVTFSFTSDDDTLTILGHQDLPGLTLKGPSSYIHERYWELYLQIGNGSLAGPMMRSVSMERAARLGGLHRTHLIPPYK